MPLWFFKILLSAWVIVMVPKYYRDYGWQNFFWVSDLGLALTLLGLWQHSALLIGAAAILTLLLDVAWTLDFLVQLIFRKNILGIVEYMFDSRYPIFTRALSLFHVLKPAILIYCLFLWGYDPRALPVAIVLVWVLFFTSYLVTDPVKNINWMHVPEKRGWKEKYQYHWLLFMLVGFPVIIVWPTHLALLHFFQ